MNKKYYAIQAVAILLFCACSTSPVQPTADSQQATGDATAANSTTADSTADTTRRKAKTSTTTFQTMGKIVAGRYTDVKFQTELPIAKVMVRNGQRVRKGQPLVVLDTYKLRNGLEQRQRQLEQAELAMKDVIISQGYDPDKTASIPEHMKATARTKSGYALAVTQLEAARHNLEKAVVTAPFDGVVANLKACSQQYAQVGQEVCRIIATQEMEVTFQIMETDLERFPLGTRVTIVPEAYKDRQYTASVSEINPMVDERGGITLRARLNTQTDLFDGMTVGVTLNRNAP